MNGLQCIMSRPWHRRAGVPMHLDDELLEGLRGELGDALRVRAVHAEGGGCISRALRLETSHGDFFLKLQGAAHAVQFDTERAALDELGRAGAVRVPRVIGAGRAGDVAYLLLEYLPLAPLDGRSAARLGEGLAELHRVTADAFGWDRDNFIGATPQPNPRSRDWAGFFAGQRFGHQVGLAQRAGLLTHADGQLFDRLLGQVQHLLHGHAPAPSLLHGDLWGGNAAATAGGEPVIFDPATYHGDRETDLAMTELFGGFPPAFRDAYQAAWPVDAGYTVRRELYNLYHVLNHLNLFGGGYAGQARDLAMRLLRAC